MHEAPLAVILAHACRGGPHPFTQPLSPPSPPIPFDFAMQLLSVACKLVVVFLWEWDVAFFFGFPREGWSTFFGGRTRSIGGG